MVAGRLRELKEVPPPLPPAWLSATVVFLIVTLVARVNRPPPCSPARLPVIALFRMVKLPVPPVSDRWRAVLEEAPDS